MVPANLIFISAQPHEPYFIWQTEVQIVNFRKHGISKQMHILVWYPLDSVRIPAWKALQEKYPEVHIYMYPNKGINESLYKPQVRPHILRQHFEKYPQLEKATLFYHDSDILFNYLPDFQSLMKGKTCWQSDCSSYLDLDYLRKKEVEGNIPSLEAVRKMCEIGGISLDTMNAYTEKTGGAQVILKGLDGSFWAEVEGQCLDIRKAFYWGTTLGSPNTGSFNHKYFTIPGRSAKDNESAGFQSWCADMWALNFCLWKRGIPTNITKELDFSWASSSAEAYHKRPIYHNAGATRKRPELFNKADWITKSPIGQTFSIDPSTASHFYTQAIMEVK